MEANENIHVNNENIKFKKGMVDACNLAAATLDFIEPFVREGVTTLFLNDLCHDFIIKNGGQPAALGYKGFPKSTCISVNNQVCHGIPNNLQILKKGDILNIDVVVEKNSFHGDTGRMFYIEPISTTALKLIDVTYGAMMEGIKIAKAGVCVTKIGDVIDSFVRKHGFSSVRDFCGHGIGYKMHEDPQIPFFANSYMPYILREGMFITIEPMVNEGAWPIKILKDNWTAVTKDMSLSAQWEHTIFIKEDGCEILTLSHKEKSQIKIV